MPVQRLNIYYRIHKALRLFMTDTLQKVGHLGADDADRVAVLEQVQALADFCLGHLHHENEFVHTAMEARDEGSSRAAADDHVHHQHACQHLKMLADQVRENADGASLHTLYLYLSLFVAENFVHMNMEETEHNAVLWAKYTDAELAAIEGAIVASLSPEESWTAMRWMVPALSTAERIELLTHVRANAPAPAFAGMMEGLKPVLGSSWTALEEGLRLAA